MSQATFRVPWASQAEFGVPWASQAEFWEEVWRSHWPQAWSHHIHLEPSRSKEETGTTS